MKALSEEIRKLGIFSKLLQTIRIDMRVHREVKLSFVILIVKMKIKEMSTLITYEWHHGLNCYRKQDKLGR